MRKLQLSFLRYHIYDRRWGKLDGPRGKSLGGSQICVLDAKKLGDALFSFLEERPFLKLKAKWALHHALQRIIVKKEKYTLILSTGLLRSPGPKALPWLNPPFAATDHIIPYRKVFVKQNVTLCYLFAIHMNVLNLLSVKLFGVS